MGITISERIEFLWESVVCVETLFAAICVARLSRTMLKANVVRILLKGQFV